MYIVYTYMMLYVAFDFLTTGNQNISKIHNSAVPYRDRELIATKKLRKQICRSKLFFLE